MRMTSQRKLCFINNKDFPKKLSKLVPQIQSRPGTDPGEDACGPGSLVQSLPSQSREGGGVQTEAA